ncbi:MAG: hypothetical protein M1561_08175 [Gammaproteobacteria bacterium]|nr:hypothetical protein [Gammaproteobacteria bacterium]
MKTQDQKQELLIKLLKENFADLLKAKEALEFSMRKCNLLLPVKNKSLSNDDLEIFEALTARFARALDILTQKTLTNIFVLIAENPVSFIDKCQLAEKLGIIKSATDLIAMRRLRNEIAHEYRSTDTEQLFIDICKNATELCMMIEKAEIFFNTSLIHIKTAAVA